MQEFCFTAPVLPLLCEALGDRTDYSLQVERPAMSRAAVAMLDYKADFVSRETLSEVKLCLKAGPSFVYRGEESPAAKDERTSSKRRKLPPSKKRLEK